MHILDFFKDKVVYHVTDSDCDGIGCRVIAEFYIKPIAREYYVTCDGDRKMSAFDIDLMKKADIVIFSDIGPNNKVLELLKSNNKNFKIFDHHIGGENGYENLQSIIPVEDYYFTTEKCGTKILFDSLTEGTRIKKVVAQFVELVNTYDLWQDLSFSWRYAKKLHHVLMESINWFETNPNVDRYENFVNNQLKKFDTYREFSLSRFEEIKALNGEKKEQTNYDLAKKSMKIRVDNSNQKYAYCTCNSKISLVCSRLIKENPDIDYFVFHSTFLEKSKGELNGRVSIRSASDRETKINVALIAEKWSGGGHVNSAGCELSLEDFEKFRRGEIHLI